MGLSHEWSACVRDALITHIGTGWEITEGEIMRSFGSFEYWAFYLVVYKYYL